MKSTCKTKKSPGGTRRNSNSPRHLTPVVSGLSNRPRGHRPVWGYLVIVLALATLASIHTWVESLATPAVGVVLLLGLFVGLGLYLVRSVRQLLREVLA